MKSFYDFNRSNPQERQQRNSLYPELANFHLALREELSEEEYQAFYRAEKEAARRQEVMSKPKKHKWISTSY
ncbi:hypothetical protein [Pontibacter liquoris]|uniref:hypothetical protein n=1 Tax=Pontibacter liquoris TaxID=2905677 RepID=UPI001FA6D54C|nr:hypothetical protein [Pontibacter liquoris]